MAAMELDTNFASRQPSMAVTTGSLPTFSLYSPGLDHDSLIDRVSPIAISTEGSNNATLERPFSNTSIFYPSGQQQSQQQEPWSESGRQQPYKSATSHQYQRSASSAAASYSSYQTGETSGAPASASTSPSAYSPSFAHTGGAEPTGTSSTALDPQQSLEQMHVSLNVPVSLGGHSSLVHKHSHASHPNHSPYSQDGQLLQAQAQHWSSAVSMYQPEPSHYRTTSSPPASDNPFAPRDVSIFSSAMAEDGGGVGNDLGGFGSSSDPRRQQQQQSHQHSHHNLPLLSQTHGGTPQLDALLNHTSGGNNSAESVMAYRQHGPVSTSAASAYLPKMHAMPAVTASPSQYQAYQQTDYPRQQPGTSADAAGRLFHPPLAPQPGLSGMSHSMGYAVGPSTSRPYPYQHQQSSGSVARPVISNLGNPGGQMTLVSGMGMSYGASSHKPLLYSQGHHSMHAHLSPSPIGHHSGYGKGPVSTNERPFRCDQCPQSFNRNHDLKRHKRIHLAVKPFPCNYCDKSFSRKDALKRHRLVKGCGEKLRSGDIAATDDGMLHGSGGGASGTRQR